MMIDDEDAQIEPPSTTRVDGSLGWKLMETDDEQGTKHEMPLDATGIC